MAISIDQKPLYSILPIGQDVMFTVSHEQLVATKYNVKFIAEIYVNHTAITWSANELIGSFKTTPNNAGVGIFDLRSVLETYLKPDNLGSTNGNGSRYKTSDETHPMHLIDKFAVSENSIKYFAVRFTIEYSDTETGPMLAPADQPATNTVDSRPCTMFNGIIQYDEVVDVFVNDYGYDMTDYYLHSTADPRFSDRSFLTTAPTVQYARLEDYGTMSFFNWVTSDILYKVAAIKFVYYWADGTPHVETVNQTWTAGGQTTYTSNLRSHLTYSGAFPANLQNWSATFATAIANDMTHYTVEALDTATDTMSKKYTINILCPEIKGYEGIRLTWLNKWGTWDYYTFNMKSTKSISTNRTTYTQMSGTWNEKSFKIAGYKGGKKNFRVNSTEKIKLNTDFVTEAEGVWFEQLINSPEVYVLDSFQTDQTFSSLNNYVQPATITNSSYTRKTIANDRLMQYSFEIEKSKIKRTQAV